MSHDDISINDAAKLLGIKGIGQNNLYKIMRQEKIIFRNGDHYSPMQEYVDRGYFHVKINPISNKSFKKNHIQIYLTPKGFEWLKEKLILKGYSVQG